MINNFFYVWYGLLVQFSLINLFTVSLLNSMNMTIWRRGGAMQWLGQLHVYGARGWDRFPGHLFQAWCLRFPIQLEITAWTCETCT